MAGVKRLPGEYVGSGIEIETKSGDLEIETMEVGRRAGN
jgi:hypothetical protein